MVTISKPHLPLLVTAVRDAIRYNEKFMKSETIEDITDIEEYVMHLDRFAAWIKNEYEKEERENSDLPPYEQLVKPEPTGE